MSTVTCAAELQSGFDHLVASIFPRTGEGSLMAFMADSTGYFDDSGTHLESETSVCAGYIATVEQWKELERNWREVDDDEHFGVFHTANCLGAHKQFEGWEAPQKGRVLRRLTGIINARARMGFISGVVKRDYDEVVPDWLKARVGRYHYTFCVWSCLAFISQWRQVNESTKPLEYVFDIMGKGKGEIMGAFESFMEFGRADEIGAYEDGLSFQSKKNVVQLQAADIIASAAGWHMNNRVLKGRSDKGEPWFRDVMSLKPRPRNRYFDRRNLTEFVERMEKHRDDPTWGIRHV